MTSHGFRIHFESFFSVSASLFFTLSFSLRAKGSVIKWCIRGMHQPGGVQRICCVSLPDTAFSMASFDAGMVSAAVFPFIYCHLLAIYLYSSPQNTNCFNCYNQRQLPRLSLWHPSMIIFSCMALGTFSASFWSIHDTKHAYYDIR